MSEDLNQSICPFHVTRHVCAAVASEESTTAVGDNGQSARYNQKSACMSKAAADEQCGGGL